MHSSTQFSPAPSLVSLRELPALIDHYFEIVDRVLLLHGFDELECDFAYQQHQARFIADNEAESREFPFDELIAV